MRIDHEYSTDKTSMVDVAGLVCSRLWDAAQIFICCLEDVLEGRVTSAME
jgi:hypothetical protein